MRRWSYVLVVALTVLALANTAPAGDRGVAEQIARKLQASGQLRGYDIRVKFENGSAWLRGRVANQQQMATAATLAFKTEGVEQVINGMTVRPVTLRQPKTAPVAPRKPVDYVADHARLVARSAPLTPIPEKSPDHRLPISTSDLTGRSRIQSRQSVSDSRVVSAPRARNAFAEPIKPAVPEARFPVEPLRRPDPHLAGLPATAQKACYLATTSQIHVTDLHMATTLAEVAEPMLLPDESAVSAGEAFVSDGPEEKPARWDTNREAVVAASAAARPSQQHEHRSLIQPMPEPTRRTWVSGLREHGLTTMRASVDRQR